MVTDPSHDPRAARDAFVNYLRSAKHSVSEQSGSGGPDKWLAKEMGVSPTRVAEFLRHDFNLGVGGKKKLPINSKKKVLTRSVMGFSMTVERALEWLQTKQGVAKNLNTLSVVAGYWENKIPFESDVIQDAIKRGIDSAKGKIEKAKKIVVALRIAEWGPSGKHPSGVDNSFSAHYGRALFRGIDPLNTLISVESAPYASRFDLPIRTGQGDWAVSMGPYQTLERRFRGFSFVVFPALRYPILGLIISRVEFAGPEIFAFPTAKNLTSNKKSFLDKDFPVPRFVADEAAQLVLYSVFNSVEEAKEKLVEKIEEEDAQAISESLMKKIDEDTPTIAFLADGILAFEVFKYLNQPNVFVQIVGEKGAGNAFSFAGGIMFREEDKSMIPLLEDSQRQLFRVPLRVVGLLKEFLSEVDAWITELKLPPQVTSNWRDDTPLFLYSHYEVQKYIHDSILPDRSDVLAAEIIAEAIFKETRKLLNSSNFVNHQFLGKLFESSRHRSNEE
jgi:hypothetical protein